MSDEKLRDSELVEEMAQAIRSAAARNPAINWEEIGNESQDQYRSWARAALRVVQTWPEEDEPPAQMDEERLAELLHHSYQAYYGFPGNPWNLLPEASQGQFRAMAGAVIAAGQAPAEKAERYTIRNAKHQVVVDLSLKPDLPKHFGEYAWIGYGPDGIRFFTGESAAKGWLRNSQQSRATLHKIHIDSAVLQELKLVPADE